MAVGRAAEPAVMTRRELLTKTTAAAAAVMMGWPVRAAAAPAIHAAAAASPLDVIIGESPAIVALRDAIPALVERASGLQPPPLVLLRGETGTGKNLVAEVIHRARPRPTGPYVISNFAVIQEDRQVVELWGWERGAFTATAKRPCAWDLARGGTLFLDEIDHMAFECSMVLARVLQARTARRPRTASRPWDDLWIITASSRSLDAVVFARTIHEHLVDQGAVVLTVPPLRQRGDDVQLLADHFLARYCLDYGLPAKTLTTAARRALAANAWPGNVRQLANVMERGVILTEGREIDAERVAACDSGAGW
jgi:DNA-binding NtrC family response regulator